MSNEIEKRITIREKAVIVLVVFLIKMLRPWEYDHMFGSFFEDLRQVLNGGHFAINIKK